MSAPGPPTPRHHRPARSRATTEDNTPAPSPSDRVRLIAIASRSIDHGLVTGAALPVDPRDQPKTLRTPHACFVTLRRIGGLRGCVGELEASRSLAESVADRAFHAAFRDARFGALRAEELHDLEIHVALVDSLRPLVFGDEGELCQQLEPAVDGVTLAAGAKRATFLPGAWRTLPDPKRFLAELKHRAGLPRDYAAAELHVSRFQVSTFSGAYQPGRAPGH